MVIGSLIPSLERLDGSPVDINASSKVTHAMILEANATLKTLDEDLDDDRRLESAILDNQSSQSINNNPTDKASMLPDTGSELTHGSTVVLAGNVAAAMRKRRNNSNPTEVNQYTSSTFNGDVSTLDILDDALSREGISSRDKPSQEAGMTYFGEGDITYQYFESQENSSGPTASKSPANKGSNKNYNTSKQKTLVQSNQIPKSKISSRSVDVSSNRSKTDVQSTSNSVTSLTGKSSYQRPGSRGMFISEKSHSSWASGSFESDLSNATIGGGSAAARHLPTTGTLAIPSPRQLNSSRPNTGAANGIASVNISNMNSDDDSDHQEDLQVFRNRLASRKGARSLPTEQVSKDPESGGHSTARGDLKAGILDASDDAIDLTHFLRGVVNTSKSQRPHSIVHLDVVKRNMKDELDDGRYHGNSNHNRDRYGGDDNIEELDIGNDDLDPDNSDEDICITHASRHRLMSASSRSRPKAQTNIGNAFMMTRMTYDGRSASSLGPELDVGSSEPSPRRDYDQKKFNYGNTMNIDLTPRLAPSECSSAINTPRSARSMSNVSVSSSNHVIKESISSRVGILQCHSNYYFLNIFNFIY